MALNDTHDWRTDEPANRIDESINRMEGTPIRSEAVPPPAREEEKTMEVVAGGSAAEGIGGLGAIILAIVGLAMTGMLPFYLAAIATIVIGGALLIEGGAIMARYSRLLDEVARRRLARAELGGGMTAEFFGGAAGIVLGILALLKVEAMVLLPIAAIAFGAALLLGGGTMSRLNTLSVWGYYGRRDTAQSVAEGAVSAAGGSQVLVGVAAIILGIIALVGIYPLTLTLVALLCLGCSTLLSGAAISGRMMSMLNR